MKWKLSEEIYLKVFYNDFPISHFAERFKRSPKAISMKARKIGKIKIADWSEKELQILMSQPVRQAAKITGRSVASCKTKKTRLKYANSNRNHRKAFDQQERSKN